MPGRLHEIARDVEILLAVESGSRAWGFACACIERYKKAPPVQFDILLETAALEPSMQSTVIELLERKKQGYEPGEEDRIEPLNRYIERQLDHFRESVSGFDPREKPEPEYLNRLFAEMMTGRQEA